MKSIRLFLIMFLLVIAIATNAQSLAVNADGSTAQASAILDVKSTAKGFLPPRMDSAHRNAISSPATGLVIYNTNINALQYFNGTSWCSTVHYIGENYGGGIVFYLYDNGEHGLIAATADQSTSTMRWYGGSYTNTCARGDGIGAGLKNTAIIIANQGPVDGATFAARVCNEYSVTVGSTTYGDWYLPSKFELNLMYSQLAVIGGFTTSSAYYWTSTEFDVNSAWIQSFINGTQGPDNKNQLTFKYVRAMRTF
jgi:hypothetical protein